MIEQKRVKGLPSSFVAADMKISSDSGAGEAKLWVGQMTNAKNLDAFFEFGNGYKYLFSRKNLIDYLNQMKLEYVFHKFNDYKNASLQTWSANMKTVLSLPDSEFVVQLSKFTDATRYYIRSDEDLFKKVMRKLAVPKLTDILFTKDTTDKTITITLEINLDYESVSAEKALNLREEFEQFILNVLKLTNTRQVSELGRLSKQLVDAGVIEKDVYEISDVDEYLAVRDLIKCSEEYINDKSRKKEVSPNSGLAYDQGLTNYEKFLRYLEGIDAKGLIYNTSFSSEFPNNRIVFGAPGTGKSHTVEEDRKKLLKDDESMAL